MIRVGDIFIVSNNHMSNHPIPIGSKVKVKANYTKYNKYTVIDVDYRNMSVKLSYGELKPTGATLAILEEQINCLKDEIILIEKRIEFMKKTGAKEFNENDYMKYIVVSITNNSSLTEEEKKDMINDILGIDG